MTCDIAKGFKLALSEDDRLAYRTPRPSTRSRLHSQSVKSGAKLYRPGSGFFSQKIDINPDGLIDEKKNGDIYVAKIKSS